MAGRPARLYDARDALDVRAQTVNPVLLELALIVLTAASFWALDRYVIGCEKV